MLLCILAAKALSFPGGTPQELANALSKTMKAPVAVMRHEEPLFGKISIEPSDDQLFRHFLKLQTSLESRTGWEGFGPTAWPDYLVEWTFIPGIPGRKPPAAIDGPMVSVDKGQLLISSGKNGCYLLKDLLAELPGKPISTHFFYERAVVSVSSTPMGNTTLATSLAKALGASVQSSNGRFFLAFSPPDFRRRMTGRYDLLIAAAKRSREVDEFQVAKLQFRRDVYAQATDKDLAKAYKEPKSEALISIAPNSYLGRSTRRFLQAFYNSGREDPVRADFSRKIDFERPIYAVILGKNSVFLQAHIKGEEKAVMRF